MVIAVDDAFDTIAAEVVAVASETVHLKVEDDVKAGRLPTVTVPPERATLPATTFVPTIIEVPAHVEVVPHQEVEMFDTLPDLWFSVT